MRRQALQDLVVLAIAFWAAWSLRFVGVPHIGALSVAAAGAAGLAIMRRRGLTAADVGLARPQWKDFRTALEAAALIGVTFLLVPIVTALFGPLQPSTAIADQPQTLSGFLVDIVVLTWAFAAFGEEVVFRGVILERFRALIGRGRAASTAAGVAQAVWFGAGHASQGLSGMVLTGAIGFLLALFFLFRARGRLWPQIIAHAGVDTAVLTAAFVASA